MILRLWSGWATPDDAEAYDRLLDTEVAPGILDRGLDGLTGFEVWSRIDGGSPSGSPSSGAGEREFLTAMRFDDLDAVARFTGGDPATSVVPPAARVLLSRFDATSRHYRLRRTHR